MNCLLQIHLTSSWIPRPRLALLYFLACSHKRATVVPQASARLPVNIIFSEPAKGINLQFDRQLTINQTLSDFFAKIKNFCHSFLFFVHTGPQVSKNFKQLLIPQILSNFNRTSWYIYAHHGEWRILMLSILPKFTNFTVFWNEISRNIPTGFFYYSVHPVSANNQFWHATVNHHGIRNNIVLCNWPGERISQ